MSDAPRSHLEYEELVAGLALDALAAEDAALARSHLESCPGCRALFDDLRAVAGRLAGALPEQQPPPELRARILAGTRPAASDEPAAHEPEPTSSPDQAAHIAALPRRRRARRLLLAAAVVALVAGGTLGGIFATAGSGGPPASCRASAGCEQVTLTDALTHRPAARVIVKGSSVWLRPTTLTPNNVQRQIYVLWEIAPHRQPVAVGGFDVGAGHRGAVSLGALPLPYRRAAAFAISLERGRVVPPAPSQPIAVGTIPSA